MRIRIRLGQGPQVQSKEGKNRHLAAAFAALLTPAAVLAAILGMWRIAGDLQLTGEFAIKSGLFSHWMVWMLIAGLLQLSSVVLNRYGVRQADEGDRGDPQPSEHRAAAGKYQ